AIRSLDETSAFACLRAKSSRCRWSLRYVLASACRALCQLADWCGGRERGVGGEAATTGAAAAAGTGEVLSRPEAVPAAVVGAATAGPDHAAVGLAGGYWLCFARWRGA